MTHKGGPWPSQGHALQHPGQMVVDVHDLLHKIRKMICNSVLKQSTYVRDNKIGGSIHRICGHDAAEVRVVE